MIILEIAYSIFSIPDLKIEDEFTIEEFGK
jgi:hypothetical protein